MNAYPGLATAQRTVWSSAAAKTRYQSAQFWAAHTAIMAQIGAIITGVFQIINPHRPLGMFALALTACSGPWLTLAWISWQRAGKIARQHLRVADDADLS